MYSHQNCRLNRLIYWTTIMLSLLLLTGILDQGRGILVVFDDNTVDETFTSALDTIGQLGLVVDSLYKKAKNIQ